METYTYGTAPAAAIIEACKGEEYTMKLNSTDAAPVQRACSIGIDSHLEACFVPSRGDSYDWHDGKLHCCVSPESLAVLCRRLADIGDENAENLRSCILETLDIEEV